MGSREVWSGKLAQPEGGSYGREVSRPAPSSERIPPLLL